MKLNVNLRRKWKHEHCIVMNILSSKEKYLCYISKRLSTAISIVCEGFSLMKLLPIEFNIISSIIYTFMCIILAFSRLVYEYQTTAYILPTFEV